MWFKVASKTQAQAVVSLMVEKGIPFDYTPMRDGWHHFMGDKHDSDFVKALGSVREAASPNSYRNSLGEQV